MQPLIGSELSRMRAEDLRAVSDPVPRARRRSLREALGAHLIQVGTRLLGNHRVAA